MKFLLSMLLLLVLSACGFSPMYGENGTGKTGLSTAQGLDQVDINLIPNESGVYLRNILIDNFYRGGYPSSPRYRLSVPELSEVVTDLDITINSETTRRQIWVSTTISLLDIETGKVVLSRYVTAQNSYNVLGSHFTTRISEKDAREAVLNDLARQIETQVALYFKR